MSKETIRKTLETLLENNDLTEIKIKKVALKRDLVLMLNNFNKTAWFCNPNEYKDVLVKLLFDFRHVLTNKSIETLNDYLVK